MSSLWIHHATGPRMLQTSLTVTTYICACRVNRETHTRNTHALKWRFHPLLCCPDACCSQGWARTELGAGTQSSPSSWGRNTSIWELTSQSCLWRKGASWSVNPHLEVHCILRREPWLFSALPKNHGSSRSFQKPLPGMLLCLPSVVGKHGWQPWE